MVRPPAIPGSKANVAPPEYYADFLKRITAKDNKAAKRPAPLSVQQYAAYRKRLAGVRLIRPRFADETQSKLGAYWSNGSGASQEIPHPPTAPSS